MNIMLFRKQTITSFDIITIRELSYAGSPCEYDIVNDGQQAEIIEYSADANWESRRLDKSVHCSTAEVLEKLNECEALRWDGFHGKPSVGVRSDGLMFEIWAKVNNGQTVYAEGSNKFPDHYAEFMRWIQDMLEKE